MNPTVSDTVKNSLSFKKTFRVVVSNVAKSWSAAYTPALVRLLNNVDFPELVYPTNETFKTPLFSRILRLLSHCLEYFTKSFFNLLTLFPSNLLSVSS